MQRTYIMLKPDAIKRGLMGRIIQRIEDKGFNIVNAKMFTLTEAQLEEHYAHLKDKPFFKDIVNYMTSGPVLGMIVEGEDVIQGMRRIMGATKWLEAEAGTIRGDFACNTTQNLIHGSDSEETAMAEIKRFFGE